MFNKILFILFCLCPSLVFAQDVVEAASLAQYQSTGTARILAMGGSSNALGGDISSAFNNPAGLSQFRTNEMMFSPGILLNRTRMKYNDQINKDGRTRMNTGASGVVLSFYHLKNRKTIRTNFGFALNQTANFNTRFKYGGINNNSSYSEKWVEELRNNNITNLNDALVLFPAGASLAFENYLVDTILRGNQIVGYRTNANNGNVSLDQSFAYTVTGGANELALSFSRNSTEKFYYGMSLGLPILRRTEIMTIEEKDQTGNTDNDFDNFTYKQTITTSGTGILIRAGVLYKPFESFRIGFNLQSPTFYTLTKTSDAQLRTSVENYARKISGDSTKAQNFSLSTKDITEGNEYRYDYRISTPWRAALAVAYVFRETENIKRQRAMVTAEVEFVNHQSVKYNNANTENNPYTNSYYQQINNDIRLLYRPAINLRLGGELKISTIMFRGGLQYQQSPFEKKALPSGIKGHRIIPSLGIGYRDKGIFADIAYSHAFGDGVHFPYVLAGNLEERIYPYAISNFFNGQILATVGFKF